MPSISISKGAGSLNHNERKYITPNVDQGRTKLNVTLQRNRIKEVYHEVFDQALERYNAKQKRNDRKIDDYYSHITHSKQEKPFHELVVQIGNKDDQCSLSNEILKSYFKGFEERNPQMRICAAYIHNDEATPHMHLDYVPFVTGQKRGLDTRVSNDKAIEQMGYSNWKDWRDSEEQALEQILLQHGLKRTIMNNTDRHRSVSGYKQEQKLIEERIKKLDQQGQTAPIEIKKSLLGVETVKKSDYDTIAERNKLLEVKLAVLSDSNKKYEQELMAIKNKPYIASNEALQAENEELQANNDEAYDYIIELQRTTVSAEQFQNLEIKYNQSRKYEAHYNALKRKYLDLKNKYEPEAPTSIKDQLELAKKLHQRRSIEDLEQENRKLKQDVEFWKSKFFDIVEDLEIFFGKIKDAFGYFMHKDDVDQLLEESISDSFRDTRSVFESLDKSKSSNIDLER